MKIIHCADFHLDSKLNANLDREKATRRRAELLHTFVRMVDYAEQNQTEVILIAGDLFDTGRISAGAVQTVLQTVSAHPEIRFYYLNGNHDREGFPAEEILPDNLKCFDRSWKSYEEAEGRICISGMELNRDNARTAALSLVLNAEKINIVMLHGQETESVGPDKAEQIYLKDFRGKGIDYLALGHIHSFRKERLDARGYWCYPGCPEGRGFDECGEHGFVLLDVDETSGAFAVTFVPFAMRKVYCVEADVTDCETSVEMTYRVRAALEAAGCEANSMVKLVLTGEVPVDCEKDPAFLLAAFENDYFFLKVEDETGLAVDYNSFLLDESLKGEFVRQVMADASLTEEEKPIVIRLGLQALAGEEASLAL